MSSTSISWSDIEKIIKKTVEKSKTREMKTMAKAIESLATYMKNGFEAIGAKLLEHSKKFESLTNEIAELRKEQIALRKDFRSMLARLGRIEKTLEKLTVDVEDEARSVVKHRLKEMGINVEITSLTLPDIEVNIYGVSDNLCIVGEAKVRAGVKAINELKRKPKKLREKYPNLLRERIIPDIYTSLPMFELIEKARRENIWLLKATEQFTKPNI
ncbi:MAG: hypothetical protein QW511_03880 [Candidatus Methanomethylicia archaeon]